MSRWAAWLCAAMLVTAAGWRIFGHRRRKPAPSPHRAEQVWPTWREDTDRLEARLIWADRRVRFWNTVADVNNPHNLR